MEEEEEETANLDTKEASQHLTAKGGEEQSRGGQKRACVKLSRSLEIEIKATHTPTRARPTGNGGMQKWKLSRNMLHIA